MHIRTVAVVGLGAMGAPMAWNVADAGFDLQVYNRSPERTEPFAAEGVPVAETPAAAATGADAVVVMVTDGDAVMDVLTGEDGVLASIADGAVVVNTSTVGPDATARAAEAVRAAGCAFVDAPVAGTVAPAEAGTLTVLAAGADETLDRVDDLLSAVGDPVLRVGDVGDGTRMKLAVNGLLGGMMGAFAESMVAASAGGLDVDDFLAAVGSGGLDAPLFEVKGEMVAAGEFDPSFPVELLWKDLRLATETAGDEGVPLQVIAAAREVAAGARGLGHGEADMAAMVRAIEAQAGETARRD